MALLFVVLFLYGVTAIEQHIPGDCYEDEDCEQRNCYDATCVVGVGCEYIRQPISECCLDSEECCILADPETEFAICDYNCTCRIENKLQYRCTEDVHCDDDSWSAYQCRNISECHVPYCDRGWCECMNTTDTDMDGDGVYCPGDCNNLDASVQEEIECCYDADNDGFPDCDNCTSFCVAQDAGCPDNYVEHGQIECDCCDCDDLVFPQSSYSSTAPNKCHNYDYNCDEHDNVYACCSDGMHVGHHNISKHGVLEDHYRIVWNTSYCHEAEEENQQVDCGSCSTDIDDHQELIEGWACEPTCPETPANGVADNCPQICDGQCECITPDDEVEVGTCVKYITHCVQAREDLFSDGAECCVVTLQ